MFEAIPKEGLVEDAVFDITGTNLTEQAVLGVNIFTISEFPAWILPSNLRVDYIDTSKATITITLTVRPNTEAARTGIIRIRNTITGSITGTLQVFQDSATFTVTILNSPNGAAVISGQSESIRVFEPGETVTLNAGTRSGFSFINWSSTSQGLTLDNTSNTTASFTMPANDVIITANWLAPPPEPPPGPPPRSPPPEPFPATSLENNPEDGIEVGHTVDPGPEGNNGSEDGSAPTDSTDHPDPPDTPDTGTETGPGGDPVSTNEPESGAGFNDWFRSNRWWILLAIGLLLITSTSLIIVLRKRKTKKALIVTPDDT